MNTDPVVSHAGSLSLTWFTGNFKYIKQRHLFEECVDLFREVMPAVKRPVVVSFALVMC